MPDNTWFTLYKFPAPRCISLGPSQGIVYEVSETSVVKLPFQYPVANIHSEDENEHMYLSLRSLALFRKEVEFYDLLDAYPHPNITQRRQGNRRDCIILERLETLKHAWGASAKEKRFRWILQLLKALDWIEQLEYTHGDLTIRNLGIDCNSQLKVFDFGSIARHDDDDYDSQVLDDHFALATCIHFLASGVDPISRAESRAEYKCILSELEGGKDVVDEAAKDFGKVIQAGWTRAPRSALSFSQLRRTVEDIKGSVTTNGSCSSRVE